jgi:hypothetical protein
MGRVECDVECDEMDAVPDGFMILSKDLARPGATETTIP